MKTIIENATILPMTDEDAIIHGCLCIDDTRICHIGKTRPQFFEPDQVIDAKAMAVLPSFTNCHTHSSMVLLRNYKDNESCLESWLEQVWAIEAKLTETDIEAATDLAICEMIKSGITAFADMYFFPHKSAERAINAGVRADIGLTIIGDLDSAKKAEKTDLPRLLRLAENELVNISVAPHAIYTVPKSAMLYALDLAKANNLKIHTHASETKTEFDNAVKAFGMSPVKYLQSIGVLDTKSILAHCVHLTEEDMKILKDSKATLVHCPSSNCKLSSGIANVKQWQKHNLKRAFGTDGASSNNSLNMIKEVNLGCMVASASSGDTQALRPFEALRMATTGGALALGNNDCGTLEVGKKADLMIVDTQSLNNTPTNNIYSALVYSSTSEDIRTVLCNGKILMKDRRLVTLDESEIKQNVTKAWEELKNR